MLLPSLELLLCCLIVFESWEWRQGRVRFKLLSNTASPVFSALFQPGLLLSLTFVFVCLPLGSLSRAVEWKKQVENNITVY